MAKAVYGGPAKGSDGPIPGVTNYFSRSMNSKGEEEGIVVSISLPKDAMENWPTPSAPRAHPTYRRL